MSQSLNLVQMICIWAIPVLFAITIHEVAHGWVAKRCGDHTASMLGRLTINPLKHIDPIGTVLVPLLLLSLGGFIFGWAKPVPVNPRHFKNPKVDGALVAAAGPISNLIMMLMWAGVAQLGQTLYLQGVDIGVPVRLMGAAGIQINLVLGLLNLLPIPPLDGSRVVSTFLPYRLSALYNRIEPYGFFILIFMIATGILSAILAPPYLWIMLKTHALFGLTPVAF
ncbi:MAG: site-2 protease family protein [Legionellales bacterium]|nr:site-2 protease family protein [Legionellales bacterium]|tara:strand:- start:1032 stop:1703 length:672 start_codon:yes stop_codon:yes gene_type:complete